ncbi:ClpXP protease specificity-enhancing factor SspB [Starkeya koreensis]|uniref:ClpXP protease specificity-enhancing factor SspB n=1 Tax=Ancylobacter koreensis TaxID=266121 RepID=A0ABT0DLC3_9HYPH|nr:ClpXP protease specificity-enhancing factor SspB [Ancylobacter koreensis]MCK0208079.1 ClpXP protease specificity-enhancing factor SspB [Ancylobacter koreensis]
MSVDLIRYDLLVQDALRSVVRRVLTDVARDGLPGDHHLYISFDTCAAGVRLSPRLKERYPEEMTIVLQHQFWDLLVTEPFFEVGLSFNGIPERLHIPFSALKGFFDPSVKFGLQFEPMPEEDEETAEEAAPTLSEVPPTPAPVTPFGEARPTSVPSTRAPARSADPKPAPEAKPAPTPRAVRPEPAGDGKPALKEAAPKAAPAKGVPAKDVSAKDAAPKEAGKDEAAKDGGAQVVRLDAFRKK